MEANASLILFAYNGAWPRMLCLHWYICLCILYAGHVVWGHGTSLDCLLVNVTISEIIITTWSICNGVNLIRWIGNGLGVSALIKSGGCFMFIRVHTLQWNGLLGILLPDVFFSIMLWFKQALSPCLCILVRSSTIVSWYVSTWVMHLWIFNVEFSCRHVFDSVSVSAFLSMVLLNFICNLFAWTHHITHAIIKLSAILFDLHQNVVALHGWIASYFGLIAHLWVWNWGFNTWPFSYILLVIVGWSVCHWLVIIYNLTSQGVVWVMVLTVLNNFLELNFVDFHSLSWTILWRYLCRSILRRNIRLQLISLNLFLLLDFRLKLFQILLHYLFFFNQMSFQSFVLIIAESISRVLADWSFIWGLFPVLSMILAHTQLISLTKLSGWHIQAWLACPCVLLLPCFLLSRKYFLKSVLLVFDQVDFLYEILYGLQIGIVLHLHDLMHLVQVVLLILKGVYLTLQFFDFKLMLSTLLSVYSLHFVQGLNNDSISSLGFDELV